MRGRERKGHWEMPFPLVKRAMITEKIVDGAERREVWHAFKHAGICDCKSRSKPSCATSFCALSLSRGDSTGQPFEVDGGGL